MKEIIDKYTKQIILELMESDERNLKVLGALFVASQKDELNGYTTNISVCEIGFKIECTLNDDIENIALYVLNDLAGRKKKKAKTNKTIH